MRDHVRTGDGRSVATGERLRLEPDALDFMSGYAASRVGRRLYCVVRVSDRLPLSSEWESVAKNPAESAATFTAASEKII